MDKTEQQVRRGTAVIEKKVRESDLFGTGENNTPDKKDSQPMVHAMNPFDSARDRNKSD